MIKEKVIQEFKDVFHFIQDKFEILDLLANDSKMDYNTIQMLKLPSEENNIVWHPGVYVFIGDNSVYRVGVSLHNSRKRVMDHLDACTSKNGHSVWDIDKCEYKHLLLFNVKKREDRHWLLAIEAYLESKLNPLIESGRIG